MMQKYRLIILIFISCLYYSITLPEPGIKGWEILNDGSVWVGYKESGNIPWCRVVSILPYAIDEIDPIVGNFDNYSKIFTRIVHSEVIENNIVYLQIGMPMFFSNRDYVVEYNSFTEGRDAGYQWKSVIHSDVPSSDELVRLINAAGEWRLTPEDNNSTKISYTWNGELLGDFPNFYLTTAWETQGLEIIEWLIGALENE